MRRRVTLIVSLVVIASCRSNAPARIGIVLDPDGERGAELAMRDIDSAGGVPGHPLALRVLRGQVSTAARMALTAAETLSADAGVVAVVGHTNSSASLAAAQIYNERHLPQIAPTTTTPLYSEAGRYSFRLVASDVHQAAFLADLILAGHARRTAVLYVNDDYGRALHTAVVARLAAHGVAPVYDAPYGEGAAFTDAGGLAKAVARSHPTTLLWLGRWQELSLFLPPLEPLTPNIEVLASDGFAGVPSETGQVAALVGVRYVRLLDLQNPTPRARALRDHYRQVWHEEPTDQSLLAYQAVQLLAAAIRAVGTDRDAIRDYLASLGNSRQPFPGIAGPVAFDAHGDPPPSYFLAEVTASGSRAIRVAPDGRMLP